MNEVDWARVADILADAHDLPAGERVAFIRAQCGEDEALRGAVERMVAADAAAQPGFLAGVDADLVEAAVEDARATLDRVGPWRLLDEIGQGGMGQVFLAERADGQFDQRVAVKLLKRGMDSEAILARFLRERQILAGLEHPNIARLLDGGIAEDHRPYFVMELVEGEPITAWADARRLTIDDRIALFRTVCDAVAHAHRNLVVHRDLKPSNILVTPAGVPKLLDFGIAKVLRPDRGDADPTLTTDDVRLMTPAYAAPEQLTGAPVTTATDVYGLGAVLYELLSGRKPFAHALDRRSLPADTEPVLLSATWAAGSPDAPESVVNRASARGGNPERLRHRLAGDLEMIAAKALRAAPERRYPTVDALDEDLLRHQKRLPVGARPDTLRYRASRFVRRHRLEVASAASIVVLALTFGITATLQARALAEERDRASREADAAREVSRFMVSVFAVADPLTPGGADTIRASHLLAQGARRVDTDLAGQPALQARLLDVIGQAYDNLGQPDRAIDVLERAVQLQRSVDPPDPATLVYALDQLAMAHADQGDFRQGQQLLREAIAIQERIDPAGVAMWLLLVDLAGLLHGSADDEAADSALASARALFASLPAADIGAGEEMLSRMNAMVASARDRTQADSIFARMAAITRETGGPLGGAYADVLRRWAGARSFRGEGEAADTLFEMAVAIQEARDSTSLVYAHLLAQYAANRVGRLDNEATVAMARKAVRLMEARLGPGDRQVAYARTMLSEALYRTDRIEDALEENRRVMGILDRSPDHAGYVAMRLFRDAAMLRDAGRTDEALAAFDVALTAFLTRFPDDYIATADVRRQYATLLVEVGRPVEAERHLHRAVEVLAARWGDADSRVDAARIPLGEALVAQGRADEAAALLRPVVERLDETPDPGDDMARRAREALARAERPRTD